MRPVTIATLVLLLWLVGSLAHADEDGTGFSVTLLHQTTPATPAGLVILYGAFCALWAQNTGRSSWLWFFLGVAFSVITLLVLLYKNAEDRRAKATGQGPMDQGGKRREPASYQ